MKLVLPIALVALIATTVFTPQANAATVNSNIAVAGDFSGSLSGSGNVNITTLSGS